MWIFFWVVEYVLLMKIGRDIWERIMVEFIVWMDFRFLDYGVYFLRGFSLNFSWEMFLKYNLILNLLGYVGIIFKISSLSYILFFFF